MSKIDSAMEEHYYFRNEYERARILDLKWKDINEELKKYINYCKITRKEESKIIRLLFCREDFDSIINSAIGRRNSKEIHDNIEKFNAIFQEGEEFLKELKEKYGKEKEEKEKEEADKANLGLTIAMFIFLAGVIFLGCFFNFLLK